MKNIAYQPTDGLSYDPSEEKYWDPEALDKEIALIREGERGIARPGEHELAIGLQGQRGIGVALLPDYLVPTSERRLTLPTYFKDAHPTGAS